MCLKKTSLLEERAFFDKEVSTLNLFPPDLLLAKMTAQVSAEKTAAIKNMVDMATSKRSKMSTSMNTIGLCKTKENTLETIANWLSLFNHNFVVGATSPLLIYSTFLMLKDLITSQDYKHWYGRSIKKAPWIPLQHLEQMQWLLPSTSKLANTPTLI
eukprot:793096-Ditylum_brightwellii.AAC.2